MATERSAFKAFDDAGQAAIQAGMPATEVADMKRTSGGLMLTFAAAICGLIAYRAILPGDAYRSHCFASAS
jgi:hypothetical protein